MYKKEVKKWNKFLPSHNLKIPLNQELEKIRRQKISNKMKNWLENNPEEIEKRRKAGTGRKHSKETKEKLSKMMKGERNGMYGKTHTDEVKKENK